MSASIPQPLNSIGCQELLSEEYVHCGWVRKRSFINKIGRFRWPQVYMILSNGCVYYFKNEYSKTPAGKFSLYGYNSVSRETELSVKQAPCAFKIIHLHQDEFKTYYFATASEKEMKEWMKHIKGQMVTANGKKAENYYYTYRHAGSINRTPDDDVKSLSYKDLEENIYEDSTVFKPSNDYAAKFKVKHKDDVSDDEDISDAPPPPPRRIPQCKERPPQPLPDLPVTEPSHQEPAGGSSGRRSPYSRKKTEDTKDHRSKSKKEDKSVKGAEKSFSIFDDTTNKQLQNELSGRLKKQGAAASPKSNHANDENHGNTTRKRSKEIDQEPEVDKRKGSAGNVTKINKERQAGTNSRLTADDDEDDEDDDCQSYWESIYYTDSNKEKAQEIIRNIGEDGVFLIRSSEDGGQVLVVFADNTPKKYKINNEGDDYFLKKNGPHAESVEMLMYIYHEECLPTATVKLSLPYKLHKSYSRVR